jgi:hypothetical protein
VEVTGSDKHSSLLRHGLITAIKSYEIQDDEDRLNCMLEMKIIPRREIEI